MTTTGFEEAARLDADDATMGGLNIYPSFVKPWPLHKFEHGEVHHRVAQVSDGVFQQVADAADDSMKPKP